MEAPLEAPEDDEDEGEDEEQVAQAQERLLQALMARTARELPRRELERDWAVLGELGSGSYGRVVLAEPRDGGVPGVSVPVSRCVTRPRCACLCPQMHYLTQVCQLLSQLCSLFQLTQVYYLCRCAGGAEAAVQGAHGQVRLPAGVLHSPVPAGGAHLCAGAATRLRDPHGVRLRPGARTCRGPVRPPHTWGESQVGLPEPQVKRCAAQVSAALSYLHGHALVHRDLKLDNVLAFDPECHLVKLGDFGLTRVLGWQVRPAPGPAPYAAPELWHLRAGEARLRLEPALDTWAFGVLLFALLTGNFPWGSPARSDPAFRRFRAWHGRTCAGEAPPRPPRTWRGLGEAALRLLRGLLHPSPGRRCPPGEVLRYLGRPWAGEGGQVSVAGEGEQVSSEGESESGQVSSAGEEGQVSSPGEGGQVSSIGEGEQVSSEHESGSGQVSSAGEEGQVSSAGERGSGQVSSAGEEGQVSSEGERGSVQVSSAGEEGQISGVGEEEQVSSAGEISQVNSEGDIGSGQVSSAGEEGQVSSAGEISQVSSAGEGEQMSSAGEISQVSSAGEGGQVNSGGEGEQVSSAGESPAGEGGSGQRSPSGENGSGQVSPTGDSRFPSSEVGTPGQVRETPGCGIETPGDGIETPGQVRGTSGSWIETSGQVRGTPGDGIETHGQVRRTAGSWIGTPGQVRGTPGSWIETPGGGRETPGVRWKHLEMG